MKRAGTAMEAWAPGVVMALMVTFVLLHGLGIGALLPDRFYPHLLFSSEREWRDAVPEIVGVRARDAEFTARFRFRDTIFWTAPDGYLGRVEQPFPLVLDGRQVSVTIGKMKWLGEQLLTSQLPDEQYTIHALSQMTFRPFHPFTTYFSYGHLHLYSVAAALKVASVPGWVTLTADRAFYMHNPGEFRKLYVVGKAVGLVFGALAIWLFFRVATEAYGVKAGLMTAAFLTVVPTAAVEARMLKPWVFGWFWLGLALWCLLRLQSDRRLRWYALAGVTGGLSAACGFFISYPLPLLIVSEILLNRGKAPLGVRLKGVVAAGFAGIVAFVAVSPSVVAFFPTFLAYLESINRGTNYFLTIATLGHHAKILLALPEPLGFGLLGLTVGGIALALFKRTDADRLLLAGLGLYYILFFKGAAIRPGHHLIGLVPLLVILAARGVAYLLERGSAWRPLALAALIFVILNAGSQALFYDMLFVRDVRIEAGEWINRHIPAGSSIGNSISPDGGKAAYVPYRYLEYRLINDPDPNLRKLLTDLPDYYLLLERRQSPDPFLSCQECLRRYEEVRRFNVRVPILDRLYSNDLAVYLVEGVRVFRKRS